MFGLKTGSKFFNRIIYYHILSTLVVVAITLLALFFLVQTTEQSNWPNSLALDPMLIMIAWIALLIISIFSTSFLISKLSSSRFEQPIKNIKQTLRSLKNSQDLSIRLPDSDEEEVSEVVISINRLLTTLEQQQTDILDSKHKFENLYEALGESEEYFRAIFEQASDAIILLEKPRLRFNDFNTRAHQTLGYERHEFALLQISEIITNASKGGVAVDIGTNDLPNNFEAHLITKDGRHLDCQISATEVVIRDQDYLMMMFHDVTQQVRTEKKLSTLSHQLQTVLDAPTHTAIIAMDMDGVIQIFNTGAERILNYDRDDIISKMKLSELIEECQPDKNIPESQVCENFEQLVSCLAEHPMYSSNCNYLDNQQNTIPVEQTITPINDNQGNTMGFLCIAQDLREKLAEQEKQNVLENQLLQSQKMETIGTLAGGIAHDLNNLLTPVLGYTEMLIEDTKQDESHQAKLQRVLSATLRAKELVKQILTFSHQVDNDAYPVEVKSIIKEVLELLFASLPPNIQLNVDIKDPDAMIHADVSKIHQVLMNLCTNAAHAIGSKEGQITIVLNTKMLNEDNSFTLAKGKYVSITIKDTGSGMPKKVLDRVFEPFFTTKDIGEGTGLGLSVVHGIIMAHNGAITVDSTENIGSSFNLLLPYFETSLPEEAAQSKPVYGNSKRILFVDDDLAVLNLSEELLKRRGYHVDVFNNSKKALKSFKLVPDSYDVVITDQSMPGLLGTELAEQIHKLRPSIPIILLTGLGLIFDEEQQKQRGISKVIAKPVLSNDLVEIILTVTNQQPISHNT